MNKQRVFMFWALMDLMYVLGFVYVNVSRGRIPLYDDAVLFLQVNMLHGWSILVLFFIASMLLSLSIFLTMVLFFKQHPFARLIAYLQTPFRLYFVVPSLSFIPWVVSIFEMQQAVIALFVLVVSEILKCVSLYNLNARQVAGA